MKAKAQAKRAKESYENTIQEVYKVVLDATYDYFSERVHKYNLGEEVATTRRQTLGDIMSTVIKSYSLKTVYGDTDSLFTHSP